MTLASRLKFLPAASLTQPQREMARIIANLNIDSIFGIASGNLG